ncbi:N-acetyltransferase [Oxobacter pfennigii]|uniref:N-acetyltransferase n=1 Tax=Oxobacter pfennigii TaxID=36849 RepID=UPI0006D3CEA1|nr:N-acetyltransferase [Oxobacter pfennigii]
MVIVRKAKLSDVEQIHEIVNYYAEKGMMLSRARSMLYEHIRDFVVAEEDGEILGTGALHVLWIDLAELRTLAVKENLLSKGIGSKIVDFILEEAKELGIPKVFTLTYQPGFFEKHGFNVIQKESMPHKVWTDCINCPKFPNCNEVCLEKIIDL